jgi:hypothetical protein
MVLYRIEEHYCHNKKRVKIFDIYIEIHFSVGLFVLKNALGVN